MNQRSTLPTTPQKPDGVQPGGGTILQLELAWGKMRRAFLRTFRPGYVRRMAELRQGNCPQCPHDILDPRDLKFTRNVCGYWFRAEDDPFRRREQLGFARHGLAELVVFSILLAVALGVAVPLAVGVHWIFWVPTAALVLVWAEVVYFFRDPVRQIPQEPGVLVSPADGTITNVEETEEPEMGRVFRISIFLSIFNVHVNRQPTSAEVKEVRYFPGAFLDARNLESAVRNEQLWVDLVETATGRPLRLKQISGAIARRIVCWLKPGDRVERGEKMGMIKFGSRTDLLIPAGQQQEVLVKIGDKVQGGKTILLRW